MDTGVAEVILLHFPIWGKGWCACTRRAQHSSIWRFDVQCGRRLIAEHLVRTGIGLGKPSGIGRDELVVRQKATFNQINPTENHGPTAQEDEQPEAAQLDDTLA